MHNIYESKLKILDGMPGTSEPLTPDFFINPRCPPAVVPVGAAMAPKASVSEGVEHSSTAGDKVGDNSDSLPMVAGEKEDPIAPSES